MFIYHGNDKLFQMTNIFFFYPRCSTKPPILVIVLAEKELDLTTDDIELLFHLFWLPHGHGPRGEMLVNEFKFLRDTAHVIMGSKTNMIKLN